MQYNPSIFLNPLDNVELLRNVKTAESCSSFLIKNFVGNPGFSNYPKNIASILCLSKHKSSNFISLFTYEEKLLAWYEEITLNVRVKKSKNDSRAILIQNKEDSHTQLIKITFLSEVECATVYQEINKVLQQFKKNQIIIARWRKVLFLLRFFKLSQTPNSAEEMTNFCSPTTFLKNTDKVSTIQAYIKCDVADMMKNNKPHASTDCSPVTLTDKIEPKQGNSSKIKTNRISVPKMNKSMSMSVLPTPRNSDLLSSIKNFDSKNLRQASLRKPNETQQKRFNSNDDLHNNLLKILSERCAKFSNNSDEESDEESDIQDFD